MKTRDEKKGEPEPEIREQRERWDRRDEIRYQSEDLIEFGDFFNYGGGTYRIKVYNTDNEIRSYIQSFDSDGNEDDCWPEDLLDYKATAMKIWGVKN